MTVPFSLPEAAARLSAVAADLAAALGNEEADPLAPLTLLDRAFDLLELLSWGMCREPASLPFGGLREIARDLAGAEGTAGSRPCDRRGGIPGGQFADEVAGVVLGAAVLAEASGVDLEAAILRRAAALACPQPHAVPVPGGGRD